MKAAKPALSSRDAFVLLAIACGWPAAASAMSLSETVEAALKNDPSIAVIRAEYEADLQSGKIERAGLLPTLDISATGAYATTTLDGVFGAAKSDSGSKVKDNYSEWNAKAELRQPLLRFDWLDRLKRARAQDALAEITLADAQAGVIVRASAAYLQVELSQDLLSQTEAEAAAVRRSLDDVRKRYEVELAPGTDLKEAQARDDLAQARLIAARRELSDGLETFAEVTGTAVSRLPRVREDAIFVMPAPAGADAWVKLAMEHRPSLVSAQLALEVARADAASSRASSLPQIDAVASGGRNDSSDYVFGQIADDARVGLELRMPLFAGGAKLAANRQANARAVAKEAELQRLKLETAREVRRVYRRVETGLSEVQAYRRSLDSAIAAQTATRNGYEAGTRTITDVLDAQNRVAQASRDWNTSRYNWLSDLLNLKRLAGTLDAPDFLAVDQLLESLTPDSAPAAAAPQS